MTTMANRMRDRARHIDLLEQVADSTEERDNVRRILGAADDPQQAWERSPWPYTPANHAHRYSACSGPCEHGRKPCPCPDSCQEPERERKTLLATLREFAQVYRLYRSVHSRRYAAWIAWQVAVRGIPF